MLSDDYFANYYGNAANGRRASNAQRSPAASNAARSNTASAGTLSRFPAQTPLAMSYTPMQQSIEPMLSLENAFAAGTLFKELDQPFLGARTGEKGASK